MGFFWDIYISESILAVNMEFQKQCEVCNSTHWCKLNNDKWVCLACIEDDIEQTWIDWEEQRLLEEE